jgi:hypothetical protein
MKQRTTYWPSLITGYIFGVLYAVISIDMGAWHPGWQLAVIVCGTAWDRLTWEAKS